MNIKNKGKFFLKLVLLLIVFCGITAGAINLYITSAFDESIYEDISDVPKMQTALLLGAKVYSNGALSSIMSDRSLTAIDLYKNKKVQKILISGDHGTSKYDEVNTIKDFLLSNGIPKEDIFLDHAGFDTYDSIYRANAIFEVESLTIISQEFHLPRAVYIAHSLDIDAVGFVADRQEYLSQWQNYARESLARVKAFIDVSFWAKPKFLGETIPITGDSQLSWD